MFKVKNKLCPEFMQELFKHMPCQTRSKRSKALFHRPNVNKVYNGECTLRSFGPIVWDNMLPENLRKITDLENFKNEINTWVPKNCSCCL